MVEDNQIKAQVSPFAVREGEIKTFDGKDGYVSMNQIVHKINIGQLIVYILPFFSMMSSLDMLQISSSSSVKT